MGFVRLKGLNEIILKKNKFFWLPSCYQNSFTQKQDKNESTNILKTLTKPPHRPRI